MRVILSYNWYKVQNPLYVIRFAVGGVIIILRPEGRYGIFFEINYVNAFRTIFLKSKFFRNCEKLKRKY